MKKNIFFCFLSSYFLWATVSALQANDQIKQGNLALPTSQRPGPLYGFGQNVFQRGDLLGLMFIPFIGKKHEQFTEINSGILYGINNSSSIFVLIESSPQYKVNNNRASGIEDMFIQYEYAPYFKRNYRSSDYFTVVATLFMPTGPVLKLPRAFGSPSFFFGATVGTVREQWYIYTSHGALITTSHKGTKIGNEIVYQFGLGKNIAYRSDKWILNWLVEFFGLYSFKDKIHRMIDPNTGGNVISIIPSLWFSNQRFILQVGCGFVPAQNQNGIQNKFTYFGAVNLVWKFAGPALH
ncbi:MAG TPA: hypothetical protein VHO47_04530 [Candidatus Babeliales bacterium]|nr:hypothetical protein [Candidatus Babeliales bacterium]